MTRPPPPDVLALWLAADAAPSARTAWLRILVAARAAGRAVTLLDLRPPGVADDPPLASSEQRWLDALAADGVLPQRTSPSDLRAALTNAHSLLPLASRSRSSSPPLLALDPALLAALSDSQLLAALRSAGQLVLARRPSP